MFWHGLYVSGYHANLLLSVSMVMVWRICLVYHRRVDIHVPIGQTQGRRKPLRRQSIGGASDCLWTMVCPSNALFVQNLPTPLVRTCLSIVAFINHPIGQDNQILPTQKSCFRINYPRVGWSFCENITQKFKLSYWIIQFRSHTSFIQRVWDRLNWKLSDNCKY